MLVLRCEENMGLAGQCHDGSITKCVPLGLRLPFTAPSRPRTTIHSSSQSVPESCTLYGHSAQ